MPSLSVPRDEEDFDAYLEEHVEEDPDITVYEPSHPSEPSSSNTLDLTARMPRHNFNIHAPFSHAHRRIHTRRERIYNRKNPDLICERVHIDEQTPHTENSAHVNALTHLSRAYAIAGYAQSLLVVTVSLCLCLLLVSFGSGLYSDVLRKTRVRTDKLISQAAECAANQQRNGCHSGSSTPALETLCAEWARCEARGRFAEKDAVSASVWAEAFAEVVNGFAERISSTAVVLSLAAGVVLAFLISGVAFGCLHARLTDRRLLEGKERSAAGSILKEADWHDGRLERKAITYRQ